MVKLAQCRQFTIKKRCVRKIKSYYISLVFILKNVRKIKNVKKRKKRDKNKKRKKTFFYIYDRAITTVYHKYAILGKYVNVRLIAGGD